MTSFEILTPNEEFDLKAVGDSVQNQRPMLEEVDFISGSHEDDPMDYCNSCQEYTGGGFCGCFER